MSLQETLFFVGAALIGLGVALAASAVVLFFRWNIPDINDDLSGRKRAAVISQMESELAKGVRRGDERASVEPSQRPSVPRQDERASTRPSKRPTRSQSSSKVASHGAASSKRAAAATSAMTATSVIAPAATDTTILAAERVGSQEHEDQVEVEGFEQKSSEGSSAARDVPESFHVVRKIVLTGSTEIVRVGQGGQHA